jgi:manganese/iron transport system ATP-binding protein/manganese/zinc/iron transport system ATP- binding protein
VSDGPLIRAEGLSGGYSPGSREIEEVDFALARGETLAVLGPNGGGKTTLFRALLGELPHREGRVETPAIAYVPQTERARLDFPVNALDVALMGTYPTLPWYRRVGREQREAALSALERVGLAASAGTRFGELSGGQRQRVLIARALAQGAEALLLDEPLSGVDRPSAERILAVLDDLRAEGRAIAVSTHDIEQARGFDRVLCLHRRQIYFGGPEGLTPEILARTYGSELIVLGDGERAVVVQHHDHEH